MADDTSQGSSLSSFVTTLVINGLIFIVLITIFILLRPKKPEVYEPRSALDTMPADKRTAPMESGWFGWLKSLRLKSQSQVMAEAGLDGYFFLRYLLLLIGLCIFGCLLIYPVLFPINALGGAGQTGLDILSISNVTQKNRLYAHVFVAWAFYGVVMFALSRELLYFLGLRQAALSTPLYNNLLSSRTVVVHSVPEEYRDEPQLRKLFATPGAPGGGIKRVWLCRDVDDLRKKVEQRDKLVAKLEKAETALLKTAQKELRKRGGATGESRNSEISESSSSKSERLEAEAVDQLEAEMAAPREPVGPPASSMPAEPVVPTIDSLVPPEKRPQHRLKPLIGTKVDTIDTIRDELSTLNAEITEAQQAHASNPTIGSAFVEYNTTEEAQLAAQAVAHHFALQCSPRHTGIAPQDVIWSNLSLPWWRRLVQRGIATTLVILLLIFWAIPVAVVGAISNINYLTNKVPFLRFINHIPDVILGVVTGLLPTILLAVLMSLVPPFLRALARTAGAPSRQAAELYTQKAYFAFQLIQVFLVTTLASSAAAVVSQIVADPSSAMRLLADNIPKSSNFYIAYILLQGLSIPASALLQAAALIIGILLGRLLDKTPRQKWRRVHGLGSIGWGAVFPVYTLLGVIVLVYSVISPLICVIAACGFALMFIAFLYNLTTVFDVTCDARGAHYPVALGQTVWGIYIGEVCLAGLCVFSKAWGPVVLMVAAVVGTALWHHVVWSAVAPLQDTVPRTVLGEADVVVAGGRAVGVNSDKDRYAFDEESSAEVGRHRPAASWGGETALSTEEAAEAEADAEAAKETAGREAHREGTLESREVGIVAPPKPKTFRDLMERVAMPNKFANFFRLRAKLPDAYNVVPVYTAEYEAASYMDPSVKARAPVVWVPRDGHGWSRQEVQQNEAVGVPSSDEGSRLTEDGTVEWTGLPPDYEEVIKQ